MSSNFTVLGYYTTKFGSLKIKRVFLMAVINQFIKLLVYQIALFEFLHYLHSKL